ncbi:retinol dehydrogenase 11-like [Zophobas morio]|uniref:retinol dehydrogenase 11-like n=1 Tax=Zophobas morio TaxID=2755281 RepID=UPI00308385DC
MSDDNNNWRGSKFPQVVGDMEMKLRMSQKCLSGKTVIVTGASTGIGFETALNFAKRGAKVILACRNYDRAAKARRLIIEKTDNTNIYVKLIDLGSFESVKGFTRDINQNEDRLDILVNNAAVAQTDQRKSKDGYYLGMQVNYFSLFLLTNLLLELMQKTGSARIVNVSSAVAKLAFRVDFSDICKNFEDLNMYCRTKLYIILFTKELARRLKNTTVTTYSVHPGAVKIDGCKTTTMWWIFDSIRNWFSKTAEEGAQTSIFCSLEKNIEMYSGRHFEDCRVVGDYNTVGVSGLQETLWDMTEKLVETESNAENRAYRNHKEIESRLQNKS